MVTEAVRIATLKGYDVLDTGALWLMAVPLPVLWGLLSFITNYIPNIGFIIVVIPPALLALLDGGPSKMILVIVVYSAINVIIQSVIQPKFVGDAVGLSTTLTFVSLVGSAGSRMERRYGRSGQSVPTYKVKRQSCRQKSEEFVEES